MTAFKSLAEDPQIGRQPAHRSIAIVTPDVRGPIKNGGVGTACSSLAELLAAEGHRVTILFADLGARAHSGLRAHQRAYATKGIELVALPRPAGRFHGSRLSRSSYGAYLYLKKRPVDIAHFPDVLGLGYVPLVAKKEGRALARTLCCVTLHGPSKWHKEGNGEPAASAAERACFERERRSVEMADVLIAPSRHALEWAIDARWALPERAFVEPCPFPAAARPSYTRGYRGFREVVFFGRIETRKGVEIFCDAIESLPGPALRGKRVTFLGTYGKVKGKSAKDYLAARIARWPVPARVLCGYGQTEALDYLRARRALAVIPSRAETFGYTAVECAGAGIPFIASDIPPFRELIARKDHKAVLFGRTADDLRRKLLAVWSAGTRRTSLALDPEAANRRWADWHARVEIPSGRRARRAVAGDRAFSQRATAPWGEDQAGAYGSAE